MDIKNLKKYAGKRKHSSQMNERERNIIWNRLKSINRNEWEASYHAFDRINEKGIQADMSKLVKTILHASIVEYKIDYHEETDSYDERVVLRSNTLVNKEYNLNVVYSLSNKVIVTAWINHINDNHRTLNWLIYDKRVRVSA